MEGIVIQPVRIAGWSPAPYRTLARREQYIAQAPQAPATTVMAPPPAAAPAKPPFIDSALVASVEDGLAALAGGILWYAASHPVPTPEQAQKGIKPQPSRWSWVFGTLTITMVLKGILDLSEVRTR